MAEKRFVSGEVLSIEHVVLTESIDCFGMKKNTIETIVTILQRHKQQKTYRIKTGTIDFKIGEVAGFYLNEDGHHVDVIVDDRIKYKMLIENDERVEGVSSILMSFAAGFGLMALCSHMADDNPVIFLLLLFAVICFYVFVVSLMNYGWSWSQNGKNSGVCEEDKINMKAYLDQHVKYCDRNKLQRQVDVEQLTNLK
jgi:hypothetical protein